MIIENSLGQKINNPENFWKWFGNSVTVDEQGRPRVFYHGTRQKFDSFKSEYRDKLAFFSYDEKFAKDWARNARIQDDQKQAYEEIEDKVYAYGKEIYKRFKEKYGEDWLENEDLKDQYYKEKEEYKEQLLKEINLEKKVLGCYLKVSKLFIPERDSDLVLDEIIKYYQWEAKWGLDDKIKVASENFQKVNNEFDEWWKNNKNATEEEKKEQNRKLDTAYQAMFSLKNEKAQFDNDLKRIKQGAWIYFEHGNVIDKIYELGYDGIQLSEAGGEQTTIAVRTGRNQIKSVDNTGRYDASENIYEDFNDNFYKWFGNSKVVDKQGKPLEVYHGTKVDNIEVFKLNNTDKYPAIYFTDSYEVASTYAWAKPMKCYLRIEKPLIVDGERKGYYDGARDIIVDSLEKATKGNYDGVIINNLDDDAIQDGEGEIATTYIVFSPKQIKSVDNKGTWSLTSNNIYENLNRILERYL